MSDEVKRFVFHETPGHGYLEVPLDFLRELEISQLISGYSYMGDNESGETMVYCEEDCDMGIVCTRMELDEIKFEIDDEYEDEEESRVKTKKQMSTFTLMFIFLILFLYLTLQKEFQSIYFDFSKNLIDENSFKKLNVGGVFIIEDVVQMEWTEEYKKLVPEHMKWEIIDAREISNMSDSILFVVRYE